MTHLMTFKLSSSFLFCKKLLDEEEEMSELQLRLLALQSASKKWQQKEQQVMKESKEKLTKTKTVQKVKASTKTHSTRKTSTPGNVLSIIEVAGSIRYSDAQNMISYVRWLMIVS